MVSNLCGIFLLVLVLCVYGEKDMRSNVAFVIDDTISMSLEISQVKARVQDVFAAVFASNKSQIGDFILITFNDNEVSTGDSEDYIEDDSLTPIVLRTVTRDPAEFLKKLGEIKVGGGGYCPELCLSGIKRAIEESNPNSYIYVFTDATAKDYEEEEIVKNLAHKKSIQITFLLTGDCDDTTSPEYTVYDRLAKATSGQVFHLQKDDINKIIDYITKTIENPGTTLAIEPINPGINEFNVTADTDMTDLNIAAGVDRGTKVNVNVIDPHGKKAPTKEIIKTDNSMVATVLNTTNGPYKIIVDSEGKGNIVVKASVNIDFRYGFRVLMPTSLKNTRTRPVSGMESHLAIKLDIFDDKVDAKLKKVLILDINNKQLMEMSANIIDEDSKFYVTAPFKPPNDSFKVAIIAVVQGTGEEITRIARTSVKAQKYSVNKIEPKSPEVVIERAPKISVMYGNSLTLECNVDAYPEPKIVWENKEYGTVLDSSASIIEVPYEYVSVLKIDNVTKTSSYECKASNNGNVVTDSIEVESLGPKFWNILQEPKDTNIDYEKDAEIYCKINAWPLPTINWYKADVQVTNDDHFHLSDDKMTLLVKKMLPELEGKYSCKASNEDNVTTLNFTITVSGGESPIIDKTNSSMTVIEGTITDIPCRVVKGFPTPIITWEFKEKDSSEFISLPDSKQELHIDAVSLKSAGVYKCKAKNRNGEDHHDIDLTVQCIPQIDKSKSKTIVHQGSKAVVSCRIIKGIPKPTITWEFKSKDTSDFKIIPKTEEDIIIDAADLVNSGFYRCIANNVVGKDTHETELILQHAPEIDKSEPTMETFFGIATDILCRVIRGSPEPDITWEFKKKDTADFKTIAETKQKIHIDSTRLEDAGVYRCLAKNVVGEDSHETELTVFDAPEIDKSEHTMETFFGTATDILCRVIRGSPEPDITWEFKKKDTADFKTIAETKQKIHIDSTRVEDAGVYRCKAINFVGEDSHETELTVFDAPEIDKREHTMETFFGTATDILCRVIRGSPEPDITWEFKKKDTADFKTIAETKQKIHIDSTRVEDAGVYRCKAINFVGEDSHETELTVFDAPEIDKSEHTMETFFGTATDILCRVIRGSPEPDITWELKKKDTADFKTIAETKQKIHIDSTRVEDAGVYRCKAINFVGEDSHETELTVFDAPEIDKSEHTMETFFGTATDILCRVIRGSPEPDITWEFKKKDTADFKTLAETKQKIHIDSTRVEDAGVYRCKANNFVGEDSHETELTVFGLPEIDKSKSNITVNQGSKATISCRIIGGNPEPDITWEFKKKNTSDFVTMSATEQNIVINAVDLENGGTYKCVASNYLGMDTHETEVTVQCAPVIDKSKTNRVAATLRSKANIQCRIMRGIPAPVITWEFRRQSASEFVPLPQTEQEIKIEPVDTDNAGVYKCQASNEVGKDFYRIELIVENAAFVVVEQPKPAKIGDQVTLHCEVTGEPEPNVRWIKEGKTITADKKYTIFTDNSLRFIASENDKGDYTCEARNYRGRDSKDVTLNIYGPVKIEPPKDTPRNVLVGSDVELLCDASGIPNPNISWIFLKSGSKDYPAILPPNGSNRLTLSKIQAKSAGSYVCIATNTFDTKSITYEVNVNAPVEIENPEKTEFNVVEYDIALIIPCKAKGYPKPTVTWMVDGLPLTLDEMYDTDADGSLVIIRPDKSSEKKYVCTASNSLSYASQTFTVNVSPHPIPTWPMKTMYIEIGTTQDIKCDLPYTDLDVLTWYKNGTQLPVTNFRLIGAVEPDSGIYSCHVSSISGSESSHVQIFVGAKPRFTHPEGNLNKAFLFGRKLYLDCYVTGTPTPTVTWWHNDTKLTDTSMLHIFTMYNSDLGEKRCEATNAFGTITRTYVINNIGCAIDFTERDLNKYHPLIVSGTGKLNQFENSDGIMIVPESVTVTFQCPRTVLKIKCFNKEFVGLDGTHRKYQDLKCDKEFRPRTKRVDHGEACSSDPTSALINVGYDTIGSFTIMYGVCYSKSKEKQVFTMYNLNRYASNIEIDSTKSFRKDYTRYNYNDMFNSDRVCRFTGRQLVNDRDLPPGLQKASHFNINVVPQWNLCGNSHNWDEVEKRIRDLAKTVKHTLLVFTGEHKSQKEFLEDRYGNKIKTSKYLWKVVQINEKRVSLAIITINEPNLRRANLRSLVFCDDICHRTDWMANTEWHNVKKGYTFCCNAWQLANAIDPAFQRIYKSKLLLRRTEL
ncbi:hemicentin-2-like isoform X2 [Epargyreus clarus]|uniref:hemicentin-2-like isoform X2 n=1 Tax=Epargyreus clarus TaxID=520877 RepID=UPI003C2FA767